MCNDTMLRLCTLLKVGKKYIQHMAPSVAINFEKS